MNENIYNSNEEEKTSDFLFMFDGATLSPFLLEISFSISLVSPCAKPANISQNKNQYHCLYVFIPLNVKSCEYGNDDITSTEM